MQTTYYKQLDALRFFSVLAVIIAHWVSWDTQNFFIKTFHWGNGVVFFFVLSGFLITEILLNQKEEINLNRSSIGKGLKTFYIRRTLRIFPVYYILIFIFFYFNYKNTREIFPWLATYTSNFLEASTNNYVGDFNHFWSLAVEEQFYIFWPLGIFFVPQKHLLKFIIITIGVSLLSRFCFSFFAPGKWMAASYLPNNVMFSLAIGALLAYIKKNKTNIFLRLSNSFILTPVMILLYFISFYVIVHGNYFPSLNFLFDDLLFALLSMIIIARCVGGGFKYFGKWLLENEVLKHLGQISYGLYLFHLFAIPVFFDYISPKLQLFANSRKSLWCVCFILTWLAAEISYKLIEKPINGLKKYFKY